MDTKSLETLEYPKILAQLSQYCSFEVSREKANSLLPTKDIHQARLWQAQTAEAVFLLTEHPQISIGGARDIRESIQQAQRHVVLEPEAYLDIKQTLIAMRNLRRTLERESERIPHLWEIAQNLPPSLGLVDRISQSISENGEIPDSASIKLGVLRRELRIQRQRLVSKLQRYVTDPKYTVYLQENFVTQRDGRYVIPLKAEHKGKIKAIVHDQSSSGATLFVEPLNIVELNNAYRELQLEEEDEQRKILAELSSAIGEYAEVILNGLALLAEIDFIFARARYAIDLDATQPQLHPLTPKEGEQHPGVRLRLLQARHPLLDPNTVVPIDVELDQLTYALVITGPNTGGKTVTLKTIGLMAAMAQSGLHIPVQNGSEISLFHNIFADIGDEQSIEQSLSTFSGHITNIIRILKQANRHSLILLDELGAGTDPQEGAALARAILSHLLARGITTIVTTHHPELKAYAHATPGVLNASVEFDLETLQPTYRLTIGLPGRSNAVAIAQRLGLPDAIIKQARAEINPLDLKADDLLDEIYRQRDLARKARQQAEQARKEVEQMHAELSQRLENLEQERLEILERTQEQARALLDELEKELAALRRRTKSKKIPHTEIQPIEEKVAQLAKQVEAQKDEMPIEIPQPSHLGELQKGSRVRVRSLGAEGIVTAISEDDIEVQAGVLRVRTSATDLVHLALPEKKPKTDTTRFAPPKVTSASPGIELDLRGKRADEAQELVEQYLEKAYLAGLPWVRIIHGKGTGKLRQVVRQALTNHPHVQSFEAGKEGEGGDGVTVAKLHN